MAGDPQTAHSALWRPTSQWLAPQAVHRVVSPERKGGWGAHCGGE
jgi:hypothetical protein